MPDIAESDEYPIYNYAAHAAEFRLEGIAPSSVVYAIEGADWRSVKRVSDFDRPQKVSFGPGEMKLYLVAPRVPAAWRLRADATDGRVDVGLTLDSFNMPWPLEVTIGRPDGEEVYHVYRATNRAGRWQETFALGSNAKPGNYTVTVKVLAGGDLARTIFDYRPRLATAQPLSDKVRVFDEAAIRGFLAGKPEVRIAIGGDAQRIAAEKLQGALAATGVRADVVAQSEIVRKARYPRVWDPYIKIHKPQGAEQQPPAEVKAIANIETSDDGRQVARTADGHELSEWRKPGTLLSVVGSGFIDFDVEKFYEPGCVLFIRDDSQAAVLKGEPVEVQSTDDIRQKWSRPWTRLNSFVGTDKLCPQLPEAYSVDSHLILFGDSKSGELAAALQASDLLLEVADEKYPGPGKALVSFAWSPFAVEKNVIFIGASDAAGVEAGIGRLVELAR
ncbi:MAG TPA: hypothetical protein VFI31_08580 [Pirellulales bacterium]|nr:hypothetical protein [Pirellulales bacterium]